MSLAFWMTASPFRKRVITIIIVFIGLVTITVLGTLVPIAAHEAEATENEVANQLDFLVNNGMLLAFIFGNNLMLTLIMFVPFIGPLFGGYAMFNTGVVIAARSIAHNYPPTLTLFALFLEPVAWLEFIAYSIAVAGSIWLTARLLQGKGKHELSNTSKFISLAAVLLLVGAVVETLIIVAA